MKKVRHTKKIEKKSGKKSAQKEKYHLRGKPLIYRDPFKDAAINAWETASDEALENFEKELEML